MALAVKRCDCMEYAAALSAPNAQHNWAESMDLTSEQESIVASTSGHFVVFAGPGSGKTRVVTEKILRLFETRAIPNPAAFSP